MAGVGLQPEVDMSAVNALCDRIDVLPFGVATGTMFRAEFKALDAAGRVCFIAEVDGQMIATPHPDMVDLVARYERKAAEAAGGPETSDLAGGNHLALPRGLVFLIMFFGAVFWVLVFRALSGLGGAP